MEVTLSGSIHHKPRGVQSRLSVLGRHHGLSCSRLLEIGCGNGDYTAALRDRFDLAVAIDLQWNELPVARGRGLDAVQMSATALACPDDVFDVVLAVEVLEHVSSVEDVCREVYRVTRPGGVFCWASPNRWFPLETHEVRLGDHRLRGRYLPGLPYLPPLHRRISEARNFKAGQLRELLGSVGFEEIASDYVPVPFDSFEKGRRFVQPILTVLDRTPLRVISGVSLAGVYRKRSPSRR